MLSATQLPEGKEHCASRMAEAKPEMGHRSHLEHTKGIFWSLQASFFSVSEN